jgi:hypothetical protein
VVPDVLERGSTTGSCERRPADRVDSKRQIEVTPMDDNNQIPSEFEEQVREIVRDEQQNIQSESVEDGDGEQWSLTDLVHKVGLTRRQALLAMFYMAGGAVASTAIVQAFSASAEAAPSDDLTVPGTLTTSSVDTEQIGNGRHYAGAYSGSDPDSRLDSALSAASTGARIYLERATYDATRTISTQVTFEGLMGAFGGSSIEATWTITATNTSFSNVAVQSTADLDIDANNVTFRDGAVGGNASITVGGDNANISDSIIFGSVTFESGTSGGNADGNSAGGSYTDNGTNTLGDNA